MSPKDKMLIEVEVSFNEFVSVITKEFGARFPQILRDQFINASAINDGDLNNLKTTIRRTGKWLWDYQYSSKGIVTEQIVESRKAIEQLMAILHIGQAYPEKATARAIKLRPKLVLEKKPKIILEEQDGNA
jgi:hypothetical protein